MGYTFTYSSLTISYDTDEDNHSPLFRRYKINQSSVYLFSYFYNAFLNNG